MDRVEKLILKGKDKSVEIKGTTFRRIYNLPSTTFVSTQRPIKLEEQIKNVSQQYQTDKKTGIIIIGSDKEIGKQYMVLTGSGLKRSLMPDSGWNILTGSQDKAEVSLPVTFKSSFSKVSGSEPLSSLEIFGRGFGHQVGMCQSGAVELGKKGWSYRQIISMYYTGVTLYSLNY
jgi:SpoIID/LytB domain protein